MRSISRILAFLFAVVIGFSSNIYAENMEVKLPTNDGTDAFEVQDSDGMSLMDVWSDGNVGIGTDNPGAKLHIGGISGVDGIMFPDNTLQTTATLIGPQGLQGVQGKKGDSGAQGVQGKLGPIGAQGVQGKLGPLGAQGVQGKKGDKGDKGDTIDAARMDYSTRTTYSMTSISTSSTSKTDIKTVTISCPSSGRVVVIASGQAVLTTADQWVELCIDGASGGSTCDSYDHILENTADAASAANYENRRNFSIQEVYSVSEGSKTFYLKAHKESTTATGTVIVDDLVALFFSDVGL